MLWIVHVLTVSGFFPAWCMHTPEQIACVPELSQAPQLGPLIVPQLQAVLYKSLLPRLVDEKRSDAHRSQLGQLCLVVSLANGRRSTADLLISVLTSSYTASSLLYCQRVCAAAEDLLPNIVEQALRALLHALPSSSCAVQLSTLENLATLLCAEDPLFTSATATCWEDIMLATAPQPTAATFAQVSKAFALLAHLTLPHITARYQVQASAEVCVYLCVYARERESVCVYARERECVCVYVCTYECVWTYMCMYARESVYAYARGSVYVYARESVYMYARVCHVYVWVCVRTSMKGSEKKNA
jgi:hypothetical protein